MDKFCNKSEIEELIKTSYEFFYYDFLGNNSEHDINIGIYSMSPTFEKIINWMDLKIKKDKEGKKNYLGYDLPKLIMYSAHDSTVGAFEEFMYAVFNTSVNYAYFASFANLELVKFGNGFNENDYVVNYYFDDKFIGGFNYEFFKKKIMEKLKNSDQIAKYCMFDQEKKNKENNENEENNLISIILIIFLGILTICLLIVNIIVWFINKQEKDFSISGPLIET
jgi:hypothetical protein